MTNAPMQADWITAASTLARFGGGPAAFWGQYQSLARAVLDAREAWVFTRAPGMGWTAVTDGAPNLETLLTPDLLRGLQLQAQAVGADTGGQGLAISLIPMNQPGRDFVLVARWPRPLERSLILAPRLSALCNVPVLYESQRRMRAAARDAQRFGQVLALVAAMQDAEGFDRVGAVLVNRLCELMACETAFLTWRGREGQRLRAVSHGEKPDRRSQESALVEEVAQEALTQQTEVMFPATGRAVAFAARRYSDLAKPGNIITLPMIRYAADGTGTELGAVVLCRREPGFTEAEQWTLRLVMEMAQPVLEAQEAARHWLPRRLAREVGRSMPKALRARSVSGRALLGLAVAALIGALAMPVPFRIHATVVIRTDAMSLVGAPFSGYIEASDIILGDPVTVGQPLFRLSVADLNLERDGLLAELAQANREAEVNRSLRRLPEMLVAQARAEEIKARLMRIDRQIASAEPISPLSGVVIEGEPAKRVGQAVNRGETILTVAALSGLYIEAAISERDLAFVAQSQDVRVTLLANPQETFAATVGGLIPSALVQDADTVFPVRLAQDYDPPDWWLPGMTGVARIEAGRAMLVWIATRRLVDIIRLTLWL